MATDQGYLQGENDYINSVAATPAEDPEFIRYVTVQQPEVNSEFQLGRAVNPIFEDGCLKTNFVFGHQE